MSAVDAIRAGRIEDALLILQTEVRQNPAEQKHRVFLFQLLVVMGQWERALVQLNVAGELDAGNLHMVHAYREALQCEALREAIFAGTHTPIVFGEPEPWIARMVEALRLDIQGDHTGAQQLRMAALEDAPATPGSIDGERFEWIADGDTRLGPILEALVNGRYYWIPFCRIKKINVEAPTDLRDRVWTPVRFTWVNGGETVGFVPTRYPGTTGTSDNEMLMACKTVWNEPSDGAYHGLGQRMLTTDRGDYSLMDARRIEFDIEVIEPVEAAIDGAADDATGAAE